MAKPAKQETVHPDDLDGLLQGLISVAANERGTPKGNWDNEDFDDISWPGFPGVRLRCPADLH